MSLEIEQTSDCRKSSLAAGFGLRSVVVVASVVALVLSQFAAAQQQTPNAALQARARFQKAHKQTGSIGNGYRPWSAWTYQESARRNAAALSTYGHHVEQVPPATAKEHLDEISKNLAATKAELAKLGDEAAREADLKKDVDVLTSHLTECEQLCASIEKAIGEGEVDAEKVCSHCSGLEDKLKAAEAEHRALLKKLGLEPPKSSADHAEHQQEKKEGAPNKKE